MKTIEEILKPRYKVMIDYPGSNFPLGEIIEFHDKKSNMCSIDGIPDFISKPHTVRNGCTAMHSIRFFELYPQVFHKLLWWEFREADDMPEYVKTNNSEVYKFKNKTAEFQIECDGKSGNNYFRHLSFLNPATQEEFLSDLNKS